MRAERLEWDCCLSGWKRRGLTSPRKRGQRGLELLLGSMCTCKLFVDDTLVCQSRKVYNLVLSVCMLPRAWVVGAGLMTVPLTEKTSLPHTDCLPPGRGWVRKGRSNESVCAVCCLLSWVCGWCAGVFVGVHGFGSMTSIIFLSAILLGHHWLREPTPNNFLFPNRICYNFHVSECDFVAQSFAAPYFH